jgi:hypothetical protein
MVGDRDAVHLEEHLGARRRRQDAAQRRLEDVVGAERRRVDETDLAAQPAAELALELADGVAAGAEADVVGPRVAELELGEG